MAYRRHLQQHSVLYQPKVTEWNGQATPFTYEHMVDDETFERAKGNPPGASLLASAIAMEHYDELMSAKAWRCCNCGGKATRLFLHPIAYLQLAQPAIADMPGPVCPSKTCEKAHLEQYRKGLGGVLTERVSTPSVAVAVAALMGVAALVAAAVI